MFLVGFILATGIVFLICEEESNLGRTINAAIALGIGIVCGLLTMLVEVVGLFMTGVHMGLFLAVAVLIVMEQFYMPSQLYIPLLITFGLCVIFALLTLKFQKECVVLATSLIGGAIVTSCSDYFLELLRMVQYVYDRFRLSQSAELCWYSWVVFGLWPFVSVIGIIVQFTITSKGYNHKDGKFQTCHRQRKKNENAEERKDCCDRGVGVYSCTIQKAVSHCIQIGTQCNLYTCQSTS